MSLFAHLRLSVRDVDASVRFYGPLMACLGHAREPRDDDGAAWGSGGRWFILTPAPPELRDEPHRYLAPGLHHVAFEAASRAEVDRANAALDDLGAEVIEAASEYDHDPASYAVFARDPDGFKVEVVHVTHRDPGTG
jgi:catechol 2,3-dioxygenase-like lactoylglutathione lyase family enzyme